MEANNQDTADYRTDARIKRLDAVIVPLIVLNVVAVMLETIEPVSQKYGGILRWFDILSLAVFTIEYVIRLSIGGMRYTFSWLGLVDLLSILPSYLTFIPLDLRFLRSVRLVRLFRMLKLARYSESLQVLGRVLRSRKEDLLVVVFVLLVIIVIVSGLMYYAENEAQPQVFSSIPAAMWWAVITLTTIGYGDAYPVTNLGRLLGAVIAVLGVGIVAVPAGLLASAFSEELRRSDQLICKKCGAVVERGSSAH